MTAVDPRATGSPSTTRTVTIAALLAVLGRPSWWVLALAGFLVRGGILAFLAAIVTLPSPLALSNVLGPVVLSIALGRVSTEPAILMGLTVGFLVAWLVVGGWFAAATELTLVREARLVARDEGLPTGPDRPAGRWLVSRSTAIHLLAHLPTLGAAALATIEGIGVAYGELTNPSDVSPIALRVVAGTAIPILVVLGLWLIGETLGGIAARRVVLRGSSVGRAMRGAVADLARRPGGALLMPVLTSGVLILDLAAVLAVVGVVWTEVRDRLAHPLADPVATALTVATLGAAWSLALVVTGLIAAWRSVALTFEQERAAAAEAAMAVLDPDNRGIHAPPTGG